MTPMPSAVAIFTTRMKSCSSLVGLWEAMMDWAAPGGCGLVKHLARIQNAFWIERAAQFAHHAHLGVTGKLREKTFLGQANAMFPRDGAAQANRLVEDLVERLLDAMHLGVIAFVGQESGMQ